MDLQLKFIIPAVLALALIQGCSDGPDAPPSVAGCPVQTPAPRDDEAVELQRLSVLAQEKARDFADEPVLRTVSKLADQGLQFIFTDGGIDDELVRVTQTVSDFEASFEKVPEDIAVLPIVMDQVSMGPAAVLRLVQESYPGASIIGVGLEQQPCGPVWHFVGHEGADSRQVVQGTVVDATGVIDTVDRYRLGPD